MKLVRYMKGSRDLATFFPAEGHASHITGFIDGDWACDDLDRKSVSGGLMMVAGCRMHSHSRGTEHALSSGESEIMSMSELMKDCLLLQFNLEFAGFGKLPIVMNTDATVARAFVHRKGVGRMKHLDVRHMWLQELMSQGAYSARKIPREINPSDMLTHTPTAADLLKFLPMIGIFPFACSTGAATLVKTALVLRPASGPKIAAAILMAMPTGSKAEGTRYTQPAHEVDYSWIVWLMMLILTTISGLFGWWLRGKFENLWSTTSTTVVTSASSSLASSSLTSSSSASASPTIPMSSTLTGTIQTRTMQTQSQVKFTWWHAQARFTPLGEREHGAWKP